MAASYQLIITLSIFVICAYGYYPGDKPILPVPTECPLVDPKDSTVLLSHEKYCTKFYMCLNGVRIEMDCPKSWKGCSLHFNKVLQVCDYPERAGCGWTMKDDEVEDPKCRKYRKNIVNNNNVKNYGEEEEE
ncbi:peritrophin-1-like [Vespa mandarinia]|uniref:peritrophin-1-like n=1 Tax=Vespa mandarinia TaxID=7446 RepID=UPI00160D1733|nr:peritrophin-1-like [Vespa mandarinia]